MNLIILDSTTSHVSIIELTEEENQKSEEFENFEDFMATIEEKYGFETENCQWMFFDRHLSLLERQIIRLFFS